MLRGLIWRCKKNIGIMQLNKDCRVTISSFTRDLNSAVTLGMDVFMPF